MTPISATYSIVWAYAEDRISGVPLKGECTEPCAGSPAQPPTDDAVGEGIDDIRNVDQALPRRNIGESQTQSMSGAGTWNWHVWMHPVWQSLSSIFGGVFNRTYVWPLSVAFYVRIPG